MTVLQLIESLQQIKDKKQKVIIYNEELGHTEVNCLVKYTLCPSDDAFDHPFNVNAIKLTVV